MVMSMSFMAVSLVKWGEVLQGFATVSDTVSDTATRCESVVKHPAAPSHWAGSVDASERRRLRVVRFVHRFGLRINYRLSTPRCQGVPANCSSFPLKRGEPGRGKARGWRCRSVTVAAPACVQRRVSRRLDTLRAAEWSAERSAELRQSERLRAASLGR